MTGSGGTTVAGGSGSGSSGGGGGSVGYAAEAGHALEADHALEAEHATDADNAASAYQATFAQSAEEANHATTADTATNATNANHATAAANLDANSSDWNKIARKDSTQTIAEVWTFVKGIIAQAKSYFRAGIEVAGGIIADTLGITGNATVGGKLGVTGKLTGTTAELQNLTVTKEMHVFKLTVDDLTSNKGAIIVTSANCTAEDVEEVTGGYTIYWENTDRDGNPVSNPWKVGDLALCLTYKGEGSGTFANVVNRYYWRKVIDVQSSVRHGGDDKWYNTIMLSKAQGEYEGSTVPAVGDNIVQLGYNGQTEDAARQTAVILSAYPTMDTGVTPPSLAFYKGINDFALASHRYTFIDGLNNEFMGNFKILVDGNYKNLTTVLATLEGLALSVRSIVRSKNILRTDGWTTQYGDLIGSTNFNETTQEFTNADGSGGYDDLLWSPIFFLKAGTYTYSHYCDDGDVELYVYGSTSMFTVDEVPPNSLVDIPVNNIRSGDTYHQAQRRYVTFTLNEDSYVCLNIYLNDYVFTMYRPMLEEGSECSDWETGPVEHVNQIKILANAIDIAIRAGLRTTGIYINDGTVKLMGDKVTFSDSNGGNTDKIWIDPAKGTLHSVDGDFSGTVHAQNLYNNLCLFSEGGIYSKYGYYCIADYDYQDEYFYEGQYYTPDEVANVPASDLDDYFRMNTYEANVINMVPDLNNWGSQPTGLRTVVLPDPQTFEGKIIEIYSTHYSSAAAGYAFVGCVMNDSFATMLKYEGGHVIRQDTGQLRELSMVVGVPYRFLAIKGYVNTDGGQDRWYWLKLKGD